MENLLWCTNNSFPNSDSNSDSNNSNSKFYNYIYSGQFDTILKDRKVIEIIKNKKSSSYKELFESFLLNNKNNSSNESGTDAENLQFLQIIAIAALQRFIQLNFTGLRLNNININYPDLIPSGIDHQDYKNLEKLIEYEEEKVNALTYDCYLLSIALCAFKIASSSEKDYCEFSKIWLARSLLVQVSLFDDYVPYTLQEEITALYSDKKLNFALNKTLPKEYKTYFLIERARAEIILDDCISAKDTLQIAASNLNFKFKLTGLNAKRTKFQEKAFPTLILLAKSENPIPYNLSNITEKHDSFSEFNLNSETLLEKISFTKQDNTKNENKPELSKSISSLDLIDPNNQPLLTNEDCIILLLLKAVTARTNPSVESMPIVKNELEAYINRVLANPPPPYTNWLIYALAMWDRCKLESNSSESVERAARQMAFIVKDLTSSSSSSLQNRIQYFHLLSPVPIWSMQDSLAKIYMSLGLLDHAKEQYLALRKWIDAALCAAATGHETEAKDLLKIHLGIKDKLHKCDIDEKEIPRAWHMLGTISQNEEYIQKAWDISGHKYGPAKLTLGEQAFRKKNYQEAINNLQDAVKLSPGSKSSAWFLYGCAALAMVSDIDASVSQSSRVLEKDVQTKRSEFLNIASQAFSRCVSLDDSDVHAWSNLGATYLKMVPQCISEKEKDEEDENSSESANKYANRALSAFKRAVRSDRSSPGDPSSPIEVNKLYNNYMLAAAAAQNWKEVLNAMTEIVSIYINAKKTNTSSSSLVIDIDIIRKFANILIQQVKLPSTTDEIKPQDINKNSDDNILDDNFIKSGKKFLTNTLPNVCSDSSDIWDIAGDVEAWSNSPSNALKDYIKAFDVSLANSQKISLSSKVQTKQNLAWKETANACVKLVKSYKKFGLMPHRLDNNAVIEKEWKEKSVKAVEKLLNDYSDFISEEDKSKLKLMLQNEIK